MQTLERRRGLLAQRLLGLLGAVEIEHHLAQALDRGRVAACRELVRAAMS
jgi:hypothetical protein